jgi:hypothetical protein
VFLHVVHTFILLCVREANRFLASLEQLHARAKWDLAKFESAAGAARGDMTNVQQWFANESNELATLAEGKSAIEAVEAQCL